LEHWSEYTRFFTALLVILNPFGALPIFLTVTQGYSRESRARAAFTGVTSLHIEGMAQELVKPAGE
jgi:multiple antibiotic resistance protein